MLGRAIREFLRLESASGILLIFTTILALFCANSFLSELYGALLGTQFEIRLGSLELAKPLLLWINDGLMAIFFFLVGLELKREVRAGELSDPKKVVLPIICAIGGIAIPALLYVLVNHGDEVAMRGWAIPAATDIAFALGILALLGERVPNSLKIFLLTLAIIDDLAAIVIIALFYSGELSGEALGVAVGCLVLLAILNARGVTSIPAYILVGVVLWIAVLKSGVHATLAGVVLAFFIPTKGKSHGEHGPAEDLEHSLHPWVAFGVLPVFAFANAGVSLSGMSPRTIFEPVPLGIAIGLFLGKPVGVMGGAVIARALRLGSLPEGATWLGVLGVSFLCGVGFTMSLFIGSLAFELGGPDYEVADRIGILAGSGLSAVVGALVVWLAIRGRSHDPSSSGSPPTGLSSDERS